MDGTRIINRWAMCARGYCYTELGAYDGESSSGPKNFMDLKISGSCSVTLEGKVVI